VGKYGTNLEGFGAFEGGVNADKGAPLVSTSSDGETALLFGPAALREIQAGCANGDFAIPPDAAGDTITEENPLPYWTWTPATGITAAIVVDSGSGSGNVLRVTVAAGTYASTTLGVLSRIIPVATSRARDSVYVPLVSLRVESGAEARFSCTYQYLTQGLTNTGTAMSRAITQASSTITTYAPDVLTNAHTPADAAYLKISISIGALAGTYATNLTADLCEVRVISGNPFIYLANKQTPAAAPGVLEYTINGLQSSIPFYTTAFGTEFADLRINTGGDAIFDDNVQVGIDLSVLGDATVGGTLTGDGVTTDLHHGITLQRTTNLTVNTSLDASATAITWSSAVKNTSLYAYWSSGSTITIPLTGWYSITCHLISGTGLGTGFAFRLYALVNGTVIAETETQAGANTTSDTFSISTIAYMTAADSLVFRASASSASKTIGGSRRSACSVVYLGNTSA
jgi:hypothetical protein